MTRNVVTGGAGFIGSHVTEALLDRGDEVVVVDDLSTGFRDNLPDHRDLTLLQGDVRDQDLMDKACRGAARVFHLAALTSVPDSVKQPLAYHDVDATGTLVTLEASRKAGVQRFVLSSTSAVYGTGGERPAREEDAAFPLSPYGAAKFAAEAYCAAFGASLGLETVILRYFNVYGPRQRPDLPWAAVVPRFIEAALQDQPCVVYGTGEQTRDFVFVRDVARANVLAGTVEGLASQAYNVAFGRSVSVLDLVRHVHGALQQPPRTTFQAQRSGDILHSVADTSRARTELGFEPDVSVEQGLSLSLRWYQDHPHRLAGA